MRATEFKPSGWVDVDFDFVMPPITEHRFDDVIGHRILQCMLILVPFRPMLGRDNHGFNLLWLVSFVTHRNLTLCIWAQVWNGVISTYFSLAGHHFMCQVNWQRHKILRFTTSVAKHESLIAGSLFLVHTLADINTLADIFTLWIQCQ